ncbi:MAG TPA: hydrogenase [Symbiobacteriaceae bacterium]
MSVNLFWLQAQACSGNTMSLLNAEEPDLCQFIDEYRINVLFHPSLSPVWGPQLVQLVDDLSTGKIPLDVLVVEGAVPDGPDGTGLFNTFAGRPMKEVVRKLAAVAGYTVAVGDCATHGGIPAMRPNPTGAMGLTYTNTQPGGVLGSSYRSKAGLPVINLPGCPAHPDWMIHTLMAIVEGRGHQIQLDQYNRPLMFYGTTAHTGCTNNEYYDHRYSVREFTQKGCLYLTKGCQGPRTFSDCNLRLWNRQSSKTRVGSPCLGCTTIGWPDVVYHERKPFYAQPFLTPMTEGYKVLPYLIQKFFGGLSRPKHLVERAKAQSPALGVRQAR